MKKFLLIIAILSCFGCMAQNQSHEKIGRIYGSSKVNADSLKQLTAEDLANVPSPEEFDRLVDKYRKADAKGHIENLKKQYDLNDDQARFMFENPDVLSSNYTITSDNKIAFAISKDEFIKTTGLTASVYDTTLEAFENMNKFAEMNNFTREQQEQMLQNLVEREKKFSAGKKSVAEMLASDKK